MKKRSSLISVFLLFFFSLPAVVVAYENESVTVFSGRIRHQMENDYTANFSLHTRFLDAFAKTERIIGEARIGKDYGDSQLSAAYVMHFQRRFAEGKEHRLWQQYRYSIPKQNYSLDFWARIEERYFPTTSKAGARTRLVMYWNKALTDKSQFRLGNELVLNLNDYAPGARRGFSQDRLLAGYRIELSDNTQLDFNYQYRYIHRPAAENFIQHQLQMMLTFNL